jgi:hypothetical protein
LSRLERPRSQPRKTATRSASPLPGTKSRVAGSFRILPRRRMIPAIFFARIQVRKLGSLFACAGGRPPSADRRQHRGNTRTSCQSCDITRCLTQVMDKKIAEIQGLK